MAIQTQNVEIPNRHTWRRHARHHDRTHRIIVGSLVIAFGAILLLRELQLIPRPFAVWELWPLLVIGAGLGQIIRRRAPR